MVGTRRRGLWEEEAAAVVAGNSDWGPGKEAQGPVCGLDVLSITEEEVLSIFFLLFFCLCKGATK